MVTFKNISILTILIIMTSLANCDAEEAADEVPFNYKCSQNQNSTYTRFASRTKDPIVIQVTNNIFNQITSRILAILLREVLGYNAIAFQNIEIVSTIDPHTKLLSQLTKIWQVRKPAINFGLWMPPTYHSIPASIESGGPLVKPGRFGWFVPKTLLNMSNLTGRIYPYTIFLQPNTNEIMEYVIDDKDLATFSNFVDSRSCGNCSKGMYISKQCENSLTIKCPTLLSGKYVDTSFIISHIEALKLYVNVVWYGENLQSIVKQLYHKYTVNNVNHKKFIVLYWTPSYLIDGNGIEYETLTLPKCEDIPIGDTHCKYELTQILKYYSKELNYAQPAAWTVRQISFNGQMIRTLFRMYHNRTKHLNSGGGVYDITDVKSMKFIQKNYENLMNDNVDNQHIDIYNDIACEWMQSNQPVYTKWLPRDDGKFKISIGGIFPLTGDKIHKGLAEAAKMAADAINLNRTILNNIDLQMLINDGQCRSDIVMKTFINYYIKEDQVMGILGPACSETVEPIAGISKHVRMPVISYSAEGASFNDRNMYPYFFRTIGGNRQYEEVYLRFLQALNWKRVAALTEDGQKYTEYISHMETILKENGISLISNEKFPKDVTRAEMNRKLNELKMKKAHIIIADIYDQIAQIVMCEAYHLKMTAKDGYVWFLPKWLAKKLNVTKNNNVRCNEQELIEIMNGHFSLSHSPFADGSAIMQENKTVHEWLEKYKVYYRLNRGEENNSTDDEDNMDEKDYVGFTYDAVWVYAYALDKLIQEDPSCISDLHSNTTINKLMEILWQTDFNGLSGHLQFGEGASRFSIINIYQWINGKRNVVGVFHPNISDTKNSRDRKIIDGNLIINKTKIVWLSNINDGTEICNIQQLATFLNMECTNAIHALVFFICLIIIILIAITVIVIWKRSYDKKLKLSEKALEDYGFTRLDCEKLSLLDKWEISKDKVVINRRLGEGAFGTVYGGEAQIDGDQWTAVAVKTLKIGSTNEDRVDFLAEAEAMKRFNHENIVKLLGVCLKTEPIFEIMEFMLYGDLKTFLLARRNLVSDHISDESDISPIRLTEMSYNIAKALSYLADMKFVHRDVACRNCLVSANRIVKLGDFGMARPMSENDYYKFNRKGMLPVRWMSPESLGLGIFTPASDVWSFGVLLYEIVTFGSFPYQGLTNNQVLDHIKNGNKLTIPNGVKPQLKGLMNACWNNDYNKRPTASEIAEYISNYTKLITPCLDVPLASVIQPEIVNDEIDLLIGLRDENLIDKKIIASNSNNNNNNNNTSNKDTNNFINLLNNKSDHLNPQPHSSSTLPNSISLTNFNIVPMVTSKFSNSNNEINYINHNGSGGVGGGGTGGPSNVYNPIEPLLKRTYDDSEINTSKSSLRKYVPMCGFKKSPKTTSIPMAEYVKAGTNYNI